MAFWQAIVLGLVQGLTEFLPISSSGHLVLMHHILGLAEESLVFDVAVHLGTLFAVFVYFRRDLASIIAGFVKGGPLRMVVWLIAIGTVPAVIIGLGLKDTIEALFVSPAFASGGLLMTSLLLFLSEKLQKSERALLQLRWLDAIVIGCFQALAILPGISRSGSTIAGGLMMGVDRDSAARFSFFLAIPAILGAAVLQIPDLGEITSRQWLVMGSGVLASMLSGYVAIGILMAVLRKGRLYGFSIYTLIVGLVGLTYFLVLA